MNKGELDVHILGGGVMWCSHEVW